MSETANAAVRFAYGLLGLALCLLLSLVLLPAGATGVWLGVGCSALGAVAVFIYGRTRRRSARARIATAGAAGRFVEQHTAAAVSLEIPGFSGEPWFVDANVLAVLSFAAAWLGTMLERGHRGPLSVSLVVLMALGWRLRAARGDRLRFDLALDAWVVEACEGGRPYRRQGSGRLRAELTRDALVLWCDEGRVGVLRRELELEERTWLEQRLRELASGREFGVVTELAAAELDQQVDTRQRQDDRQGQEQ